MKRLRLICVLIIFNSVCKSLNKALFEIEKNQLSDAMKEFITFIIERNRHEKDGFLFVCINKVEPEFSNFAVNEMINKGSSVIILNFDNDNNNNIKPLLNPNHLKFVFVDPESDLSHADHYFKKVRVSRAKIVLIFTKEPANIFVNYVLESYHKIQCINVILAYESGDRVQVVTYNPYVPTSKFENLTESKYSQDMFYDKTANLYGTKINALLTYADRTKVKKVYLGDTFHYEGKDYNAIQTIISHLNGNLQIETLDNMLFNPWFESIAIPNRTQKKISELKKRNISILIKSEAFTMDDEILDNLYPHTQNDLSALAPKSSYISINKMMVHVYTPSMWIISILAPFVFFIITVCFRKFLKYSFNPLDLYFDIVRLTLANNVMHFSKKLWDRFLLYSWLLYCFISGVYFQSKITSLMAVIKYYPNIDTIEKFFTSGLPLYSIPLYIKQIETKYAGTDYEVYAKSLMTLSSNEGFLDQMIYAIDVYQIPAFLIEHDLAVFVSKCKNFRKNGAQVYHLVRESIIPSYQTYKITHNSPLLSIFNKKLRRLEEGGFIDLWARMTIHNATVEGFLLSEELDEPTTAKPLSLDVTTFWFYILFAGYLSSAAVFLLELIVYKISEFNRIPFLN